MENKSIVSKVIIVIVLLVAISCVVYYKNQQQKPSNDVTAENGATTEKPGQTSTPEKPPKKIETENPKSKVALPRLVDLGAGKCIPCKMMEPILEELREKYHGKLEVVFIDVWKNPEEKERYGIKLIPTQIFYDSSGKELFRHEGFYAKEDILAKWKELGIELEK